MKKIQQVASKLEAHRFKNFGLRGDLPLWIQFKHEANMHSIDTLKEAKRLLLSVYEQHTGVELKLTDNSFSGVSLKKESAAMLSKHNHGMSEGMVSAAFWLKVYDELDEILA